SASSRVRASSCFFNSISELGSSLTCALTFVPVERGLRLRVGLFAPLRAKITSSAQSLAPSRSRPGQGWSLSILTEPRDEFAASDSITSSPLFAERDLWNVTPRPAGRTSFLPLDPHHPPPPPLFFSAEV